jgi:2-polyprenyl-3-methyl-5-hydroxy-6-metoxy-1,4-benzoquinol methylase
MKKQTTSKHYNADYFNWQKKVGEFGGWANLSKFSNYISYEDAVLDFGCGGGFLLKNLHCKKKIGIEVNDSALEIAKKNGIEVHKNCEDIQDNSIDVIISNNALEHTLHPLDELKTLWKKLKEGVK